MRFLWRISGINKRENTKLVLSFLRHVQGMKQEWLTKEMYEETIKIDRP